MLSLHNIRCHVYFFVPHLKIEFKFDDILLVAFNHKCQSTDSKAYIYSNNLLTLASAALRSRLRFPLIALLRSLDSPIITAAARSLSTYITFSVLREFKCRNYNLCYQYSQESIWLKHYSFYAI